MYKRGPTNNRSVVLSPQNIGCTSSFVSYLGISPQQDHLYPKGYAYLITRNIIVCQYKPHSINPDI